MDSDNLEVTSNWDVLQGEDLKQAFIISNMDSSQKLEDIVKNGTSSPILLAAPATDASEACEVHIKTMDKHHMIEQIEFLANIKTSEVFGNFKEYVGTYFGENLSKVHKLLHSFVVKFDQPIQQCTFKLINPSNDHLWIFGGIIRVTEKSSPDPESSSVSMADIKKRLENGDQKLSDKASRFLQLMEKFNNNQKSSSSSLAFPTQDFMKYLPFLQNQMPKNQNSDKGVDTTNLDDVQNRLSRILKNEPNSNCSKCEHENFDKKIESEIKKAEENISKQIQEVEQRINSKLDLILEHFQIS